MEPPSSNCYMLHLKMLPCWLQLLAVAVAAWHREAHRLLPSSPSSILNLLGEKVRWEREKNKLQKMEKKLHSFVYFYTILQFTVSLNVHVSIKDEVDSRKLVCIKNTSLQFKQSFSFSSN